MSHPLRIRMSAAVPAALVCCALAAAPVTAATPSGAAAPGASSGGAAPGVATDAAGGTAPTAPASKPVTKAVKPKPVPLSAHLGQRPLRRGAHGHDVRVLQAYLTQAGFPTPIAGIFGPQTERNVRAFEHAQGLRADGVLSRADATVLRRVVADVAAPAAAPAAPAGPVGPPPPPPAFATLRADGTARAPAIAPAAVRAVIASANQIASTPYLWGGGHARWDDSGYDCSGSVSFALHGAGLLDASEDSTGLESYGDPGPGRWITLYANADHVYAVIAGLRYDTSGAKPSRWQAAMRPGDGFVVRHPAGL